MTEIPTDTQLPQAPQMEGADNVIRWYLDTLKRTLLHPVTYFRQLPALGGYGAPLTFALVSHWIGVAGRSAWLSASGDHLTKLLMGSFRWGGGAFPASPFGMMWSLGSVIVDPFLTLISIFFSSVFVYLGARLLVPAERPAEAPVVNFESAVRIVSFGSAASILQVVPFVGPLITVIWVGITTFLAAREVYRISNTRAAFVILFPQLILLAVLAVIAALVIALAFKMAGVVFS
jgi:hypothetical protein